MRNAIRIYGYWVLKIAVLPYVKVIYKNSQKEKTLPCIFICNHRSASDPYLMALLGTELVQVVKKWPFKIPFYGYFAKKAEYISVHNYSFEDFSEECSRLLSKGISIAAFPEGTRSGNRETGNFTSSIFRIAIANKIPICPVCIVGNENIPDRNFNMHSGKIIVHRLPTVFWKDYKDLTSYQLKNYIREIIVKECEKLYSQYF